MSLNLSKWLANQNTMGYGAILYLSTGDPKDGRELSLTLTVVPVRVFGNIGL